MADTKVNITVSPSLEEVRKRLDRRRAKLADMRAPYARAAIFLDQWVQKNFKSEGGNVGGWVPFADSTLRSMERSDPGRMPAKLLQKTGALRMSFLPFATANDAGVASKLPYASSHHKGGGNLPERRLLPRRKEVIADVKSIMRDHVRGSLK